LAIPPSQHPAAKRLAALSRQYHEIIGNHATSSPKELLHAIFVLLAQLYWAGLVLPGHLSAYLELVPPSELDKGPPEDTPEPLEPTRIPDQEEERVRLSLTAKLGSMDAYNDVFDPYELPENRPVSQSISRDMAVIYRDLTEALMEWERGEHVRAIIRWNHSFRARWGRHTLGVLRALHFQARNYDLGWPGSGEGDA
jgi:uncharacterized protein DUF5063